MPEQEWWQVASDYLDGFTPARVAEMHLTTASTIIRMLESLGVRLRSYREARLLSIERGFYTESKYTPSLEEIEERAKEIREKGFWGGNGKSNHSVFHPPWDDKEYDRRGRLAIIIPFIVPVLTAPRMNGHKILSSED